MSKIITMKHAKKGGKAMQRTNREPVTLTTKQVADRYGLSMGTLANWRYLKKGPKFFKIGNGTMVLYKTADVEEFLLSTPILTKDSLD